MNAASLSHWQERYKPRVIAVDIAGRVPPNNEEAEAAVLSAVLTDERALEEAAKILPDGDRFYSDANRRIYDAAMDLRRTSGAVDIQTVAAWLRDRDRLQAVGGVAYLADIVDKTPSVAHVAAHARIVNEKWRVRRLIETCQMVAAEGHGDYGDSQSFIDGAERQIRELSWTGRVRQAWPSLRDQILTIAPPKRRLRTGIATIDDATRGGIPMGSFVTLQAPPGAGKTTLASQLARHWAKEGETVRIYAADEGAEGWLTRIGQNEGLVREDMENGDTDARLALASKTEGWDLVIVDADGTDAPLDDVVASLEKPSVIFVDLIQTARMSAASGEETPKARVDRVTTYFKHVANKHGHLVIGLSEVGRGAYRSGRAEDRVDPLAAGKESGSIESRSWMVLHLSSVKDGNGAVDAEIAKNRFGSKTKFRLSLDRDRALFTEVDLPEETRQSKAEKYESLKAKIVAVVRANSSLTSSNGIHRVVGGNKAETLEAVNELMELGIIGKVSKSFRVLVPARAAA